MLAADPPGPEAGDVGWTPLVHAPALGRTLCVGDLWLKDETTNPTGSFKDRVVATALAEARARAAHTVACASTGNLARALAVAGPRWGMQAVVLVPASATADELAPLQSAGATVLAVDGPYDAANRLSVEASMDLDHWGWVNVDLRPWYVEGGATVGYELVEQLGWELPSHVVAPMASGALVVQLARSFDALRAVGLVDARASTPRISTAQPAGCAPVADAFARGASEVAPVRAATVAPSLAMGDPPEGPDVLALARSTGGAVVAADEDDILRDAELVAETTGIAVEPAGGVVVGALRRLVAAGLVDDGQRVVAVLTGGAVGQKGVASSPPVTIEPTLAALRAALDDRHEEPR